MKIPYGRHHIDKDDLKSVIEVLNSDYLTQGNKVVLFENKIKKSVNCKYALAVNSASSALQIACMAIGIQKNDNVWTVPITFAASANCAINLGASIDFVDININTYNMDVDILEQKLIEAKKKNKLPKLVIPVHFSGQPTEQEQIWKLSKKYNFKIIEDASHSLGAKRNKEKVGSCKWSDITIFSFHPVKMITTIEGGMSLTNNVNLYNKMNLYRNNGITKNKNLLISQNKFSWYYEMQTNGYNFRMNEIQSALGISQLKKLNNFLKIRNQIAKLYNKNLIKNDNIQLQNIQKENFSSNHLYVLRLNFIKTLKKKSQIMDFLSKKGFNLNVHYIPLHFHPFFKKNGFKKGYLPNSELYYLQAISLPIFVTLTEKEINKVINIFNEIIKNE